jgi:hypothetical protein
MSVTITAGFRRRRTDNFGPNPDMSEQASPPDRAFLFDLVCMSIKYDFFDVPVLASSYPSADGNSGPTR